MPAPAQLRPVRRPRRAVLSFAVGLLGLFACGATGALAATSEEVGRTPELVRADAGTPGRLAPLTAPRRPRPAATIVSVRRAAAMRSAPGGRVIGRLEPRTEFGGTTAMSVVRRRGRWVGVTTAKRRNGSLGWLDAKSPRLRTSRTRLTIHVDRSARRLELRRGSTVLARSTASIGRPGSPTPTGRFAVTDKLRGDRFGSYYGCCILALSGTQPNTPPGWPGGNRLAIHGTPNPASLGGAVSAGCVHASASTLERLMRDVPVGTPVIIRD